jgi:cob(I)alamin adenosyltransferase
MAKFYTRTGDDGFTNLLGEGRVPKYHPRPDTIGVIDEATATLGLGRANCLSQLTGQILLAVQRDLYNMMAEVASTPGTANRFRVIDETRVDWLESQTDQISKLVEIPKDFIVPGDSKGGACLALARTVVRRAERRVAELLHSGDLENAELLRYLNRLSSLCFVLELLENQTAGHAQATLAKDDPQETE